MKTLNDYIKSIKDGKDLSVNESEDAFDQILLQKAEDNEIVDFLTSLSKKCESVDEIFGAVISIKKKANIIKGFSNSFDTCGTGGDGSKTFNISTISAIVAASSGICVAKHGNKAVSSLTGSADVLSELGININLDKNKIIDCLNKINLCFLFAPNFHPILKNVADIRKKIGKRTIFNILGPLLSPVECKKQIMGVYDANILLKVAEVLKKLGTEHAWVVSGNKEYDELTTTGKNYIVEIKNNKIKELKIDVSTFGIEKSNKEDLIGGDSKENAKIIKGILNGKISGAKKDIVLLNAASALYINGKTKDIKSGLEIVNEIILSGKALKKLNDLIELSNS
jgi:anthranilate phosphoribosyltransferase